ncbi:MAG: SUF system NifU family Fe-S cluster assembly protein [Legionellales bacterium]|nr:SUF system NifU family Fe-S cluster assembly protein [Legionellales bacterium]|tara:strand:+ start:32027 stop:32476 length:450 start_codon:yes stop_codon:yes gene_type:complete
MNDLRELYQQVIVDHNRSPRNFGEMHDCTSHVEGFNPLCGDHLTVYLHINNGNVEKVSFTGQGCAISTASASIMTETLQGKTVKEAEQLFQTFHELMTAKSPDTDMSQLGKLSVLAGVREYPSRIKCATLAWHAIHEALTGEGEVVSTE